MSDDAANTAIELIDDPAALAGATNATELNAAETAIAAILETSAPRLRGVFTGIDILSIKGIRLSY